VDAKSLVASDGLAGCTTTTCTTGSWCRIFKVPSSKQRRVDLLPVRCSARTETSITGQCVGSCSFSSPNSLTVSREVCSLSRLLHVWMRDMHSRSAPKRTSHPSPLRDRASSGYLTATRPGCCSCYFFEAPSSAKTFLRFIAPGTETSGTGWCVRHIIPFPPFDQTNFFH